MKNSLTAALLLLPLTASADGWREALSRDFSDPERRAYWAKRFEEDKKLRPAVSEEDALRWDFEDDEKNLTMTLSRKALERHAELYRRWNEDPGLRLKYKDNEAAYLGKMNGRVAAAMLDAVITPLNGTRTVERLPLTGRLVSYLVGTMELAEKVDSGQFDLLGADVDDFFRDRFRGSSRGGTAAQPTVSSTARRLRVRVRPHGDYEKSKVAVVYSATPAYELLRGGRFEVGAEMRPLESAEIARAWVGVTRPWPGDERRGERR
ncbi:MAG: hypothetical protein M0D55_00705 [Elusimicrobiota bacterium]|nr:MAG: hypothetical protein M0D55_00705 [Elusimicrobiota bacterium]